MTRAWAWVEVQDLRRGMVVISEADLLAGRYTVKVVERVGHWDDGTVRFRSLAGEGQWRESCHVDERRRWAWIVGEWWDAELIGAALQLAEMVVAITPHTLGLKESADGLARHVLGLEPVTVEPTDDERAAYGPGIAAAAAAYEAEHGGADR